MAITVTAAADSQNLTTIPRVKRELSNAPGTDDPFIDDLIASATAEIQNITGRTFIRETVQETFEGNGRLRMRLSRTPIVTLTQVLNDGTVWAAANYALEDREGGTVFASGRWPKVSIGSPGIEPVPIDESSELIWRFDYEGGYEAPGEDPTGDQVRLPADLERACRQIVVATYRSRGIDGRIKAESLGDHSVTYGDASDLQIPPRAMQLLKPYIRW